tara:strand:+ start:58 stop:1074 length:1017 start_codon:yes stop_codon:yes gene_type:complete
MPHVTGHNPGSSSSTGSSGSSSDARDAYIAASSGSTTFTPPKPGEGDGTDAGSAFEAGVASTQNNIPGVLQDTVTTDSSGNFVREINPLREQLENINTQDQAFDFINNLNQINTGGVGGMGILDPNLLGYIKDPLVGLGAFTTDPNETRNVYQLLMNKMFQGDDERMRGALPISQSAVQGLDRIGATNFVDPRLSQGFFGDLKSLFTGENAANINLSDLPGGGIATLPEFGQAGLDFTKDQGFRDYGRIIEDLVTAATPLKYGKMLGEKTLTGFKDFYNSLYPGRAEPNITSSEEENLDTLIDSIDEEADGELAKEILFGIEPTKMKNENKKKEFFFF